MILPRSHGTLPKNRPVERVASDDFPFGWQLNRNSRPFIHDVEHAAAGRDEGAHAGHAVVVPRPTRAADPLQMSGRSDGIIVRDGVSAGVVQVVCPFVDRVGPRLDRFLPGFILFDVSHAARGQHAQYLLGRNAPRLAHHDKIHQVVHVRKTIALPVINRDLSIVSGCLQVLSRGRDVAGVPVQSMNLVTGAGTQCGGQCPVATADMHNQPALDSGGFEYLLRGLFLRRPSRVEWHANKNRTDWQKSRDRTLIGRHDALQNLRQRVIPYKPLGPLCQLEAPEQARSTLQLQANKWV